MKSWMALFLLQTDLLMSSARFPWDVRQLVLDSLRRAMK
jgi:hypothetical protein